MPSPSFSHADPLEQRATHKLNLSLSVSLLCSFIWVGTKVFTHLLPMTAKAIWRIFSLSLSHTHPYSLPLYARFRHTHSLYHEQFISKHCRTINVFLSGPFSASFLHFCLLQCTGNTCSIKIPTDWIRTEDIWFHSATTSVH